MDEELHSSSDGTTRARLRALIVEGLTSGEGRLVDDSVIATDLVDRARREADARIAATEGRHTRQ